MVDTQPDWEISLNRVPRPSSRTHQHFKDQHTQGIPVHALVISLGLNDFGSDCWHATSAIASGKPRERTITHGNQEYHLHGEASQRETPPRPFDPHSHSVHV